jgi:hypothetical protein
MCDKRRVRNNGTSVKRVTLRLTADRRLRNWPYQPANRVDSLFEKCPLLTGFYPKVSSINRVTPDLGTPDKHLPSTFRGSPSWSGPVPTSVAPNGLADYTGQRGIE